MHVSRGIDVPHVSFLVDELVEHFQMTPIHFTTKNHDTEAYCFY